MIPGICEDFSVKNENEQRNDAFKEEYRTNSQMFRQVSDKTFFRYY